MRSPLPPLPTLATGVAVLLLAPLAFAQSLPAPRARVDGYIEAWLPPMLLALGPGRLQYWQWIALPFTFLTAWALGFALAWLTKGILGRLTRRTAVSWDDELLLRLSTPITLAWTVGATYVLLALLGLDDHALAFVNRVASAGLLLAIFWALLRSIHVAAEVLATSWTATYPGARSLVPLGSRVAQVGVVGIAVVTVLADLGYPVASLIAGLGIGGLAVALAAQKTVENLIGAFALGVDQPLRVGDYVKVDDFTGVVEAIGLRSTRIRTLDRTLIALPNGKLADMRIENYAARDRIRLACSLGLRHGTTPAQLRAVLAGVETALRAQPDFFTDDYTVRFKEITDQALVIDVMAWFTTTDWAQFLATREAVLLRVLEVVRDAGTGLAVPVRLFEGPTPRV